MTISRRRYQWVESSCRIEGCPTCGGSTQIRVFACSEFGEGTIAIGMTEVCEQCKMFDDERESIDVPYSFT